MRTVTPRHCDTGCAAQRSRRRGGRASNGAAGAAETQGVSTAFYRVPNRSSEYTLLPSGVPRGWWRSVHATPHVCSPIESFIDELAHAAQQDPIAYRLALIDQPPTGATASSFDPARLEARVAVLPRRKPRGARRRRDARRASRARSSGSSYGAEIVEVSVERGSVRVHRVVVAVDCGPVVNLSGARAQIEGGVTQALSAALKERITIAGGRVAQGNFDDYPVLRISEAPVAIEVHFVDRDDVPPTGLGELPVPPLAPALANAIARATGQRLRSLPLALYRHPERSERSAVAQLQIPRFARDDCYFLIVAPVSCAIAPSVVCAAFRPSRKSLSLYVV